MEIFESNNSEMLFDFTTLGKVEILNECSSGSANTFVYCIPCDFCGETSHTTENCPHAVDLKAAHEYQMTR